MEISSKKCMNVSNSFESIARMINKWREAHPGLVRTSPKKKEKEVVSGGCIII